MTCSHAADLAEVTRQREKLADVLQALFGLIEDGSLIRDISRDAEQSYAVRALTLVRALADAQDALKEVGRKPQ